MEGMTIEKLQVIIEAYTKPFKEELKKIKSQMKQTSDTVDKSTSKMRGSFNKVKKAVAVAFSVAALVNFSTSCIKLGSDLVEIQNVVDTTFQTMNESVNNFAKNAIEKFGLSESVTKRYMGTLGTMSKSMGFTESEAYELAKTITGLTGDVASFYNISVDDAFAKLTSIWTGETETLKGIGVLLTEANLDQYALRIGIGKTINEMTQQEKVLLRYQYALDALSAAQGDFQRTSGTWANQVRVLNLRFDSLKATLGQGLINVFTPVIRLINSLLSELQKLADGFKSFTDVISGNNINNAKAITDVNTDGIVTATDSMNAYTDSVNNASKALDNLFGFDKINKISDDSESGSSVLSPNSNQAISPVSTDNTVDTSGMEASVKNIQSILTSLNNWISNNFGTTTTEAFKKIGNALKGVKKTIKSAWGDLKTLGNPIKTWFNTDLTALINTCIAAVGTDMSIAISGWNTIFSDVWNAIMFPVLNTLVTNGLPVVTQFATQFVSTMSVLNSEVYSTFSTVWSGSILPILESFGTIFSDVIVIVKDFWDTNGVPIFNGIKSTIKSTFGIVSTIYNSTIKPIMNVIKSNIDKLWKKHLSPLLKKILGLVAELVLAATEIYTKTIAPIIKWVSKKLSPVIVALATLVSNTTTNILGWISTAIGNITTVMSGIITFITGVFTLNWKKAWNGIKKVFKGVWNFILDSFSQGGTIFAGIVDGVAGVFTAIVKTLIGGINKVIAVPFKTINGLLNKVRSVSILGAKPFSGLWDKNPLPVPEIPVNWLAKGGIVNRATLSVIGEAGREAVVPLEHNTGWMDKLSNKLASSIVGMISGMNNRGSQAIYLYIDGEEVKNVVVKRINQDLAAGKEPLLI